MTMQKKNADLENDMRLSKGGPVTTEDGPLTGNETTPLPEGGGESSAEFPGVLQELHTGEHSDETEGKVTPTTEGESGADEGGTPNMEEDTGKKKRKRTTKKAAQAEKDPEPGEDALIETEGETAGDGAGAQTGGIVETEGTVETPVVETDGVDTQEREDVVLAQDDGTGAKERDEHSEEEGTGPAVGGPDAETVVLTAQVVEDDTDEDDGLGPIQRGTAVAKRAPRPATAVSRRALAGVNLKELDRNLSEEERQEWNDIYASYRAQSVLTGPVFGVDETYINVRDRETGMEERKLVHSVVVIQHRVKVLIPEPEMWMPGHERPSHVLKNIDASMVDYVIIDVDREGEVAIASRRMAMAARRHYFKTAPKGHREGDLLQCRVLAVGPKRCLVECAGFDISLTQRDLSYTAIADLRKEFHPGQELTCQLKEYDPGEERLIISVKEAGANPFDGAVLRHPVGSRRHGVISGKYGGGVFCTMPDKTTCLCLYSAQLTDRDFRVGDKVILAIQRFDFNREIIYGRILAKW